MNAIRRLRGSFFKVIRVLLPFLGLFAHFRELSPKLLSR